jgi:hypothetical protein
MSVALLDESVAISMQDAYAVLAANLEERDHGFWQLDYQVTEILPEIRERVTGPRQTTDALLLDLAIRRNGRLATLDLRIEALLAPNSPLRGRVEILPVS